MVSNEFTGNTDIICYIPKGFGISYGGVANSPSRETSCITIALGYVTTSNTGGPVVLLVAGILPALFVWISIIKHRSRER